MGVTPITIALTPQEKKFWEEKKYLKDPEKDLVEIDRARHAYDKYLKKAKKKKLSPEDRLKMAEVNPSGNEN